MSGHIPSRSSMSFYCLKLTQLLTFNANRISSRSFALRPKIFPNPTSLALFNIIWYQIDTWWFFLITTLFNFIITNFACLNVQVSLGQCSYLVFFISRLVRLLVLLWFLTIRTISRHFGIAPIGRKKNSFSKRRSTHDFRKKKAVFV